MWQWNHTAEAESYAWTQLSRLDRGLLIEIAAEWRMHEKGRPDDMWAGEWPKALNFMRRKFAGRGRLAITEYIWALALEQSTCENGGWDAHMCPYGCMPHSVPFGPEDQVDLSEVYTYA